MKLPENFADITNEIAAGCPANQGSRFIITGRGGLPENPHQTLRSQTVWRDLRDFGEPGRTGNGEIGRNSQSPVPSPQSPFPNY